MTIHIVFACGHRQVWQDEAAPRCHLCGERQIARTDAPPPRFSGVGSSPLQVKESKHGAQ